MELKIWNVKLLIRNQVLGFEFEYSDLNLEMGDIKIHQSTLQEYHLFFTLKNQHQELDFLFVSKCLYVSLIFPDFIEIDPENREGTKVLVARHQNSGAPNVPD